MISNKRQRLDSGKPLELLGFTSVVHFTLVPEKVRVVVHKSLFEQAIDPAQRTDGENLQLSEIPDKVVLNCDPATFDVFLKYLYKHNFTKVPLETLLMANVLGSRLRASEFRQCVFREIKRRELYGIHFTAAQIKYIFDNTFEGDHMKQFCISLVGTGIIFSKYTFAEKVDQELLAPYMGELMQGVVASIEKRCASNGSKQEMTLPQSGALSTQPPPHFALGEVGTSEQPQPQCATS